MLTSTFLHIPGVGIQTERDLWSSGILSWDDCLKTHSISMSPKKHDLITRHIEQSAKQLNDCNPHYFGNRLPSNQIWRLFPEFRGSIAYLDIETTGLDSWGAHITTIALYDGNTMRHYIHGQNLGSFVDDIQNYQILVTYNGKCFDLPFIRNSLDTSMGHVHIDLRYVLNSLGYRGGLKGCEKQLGLDRGDLEGVDGFFAVLLWNDFIRNNNEKALETLLAYNVEDVVNLEILMVLSYNSKLTETGFFADHRLPVPSSPCIPFKPDRETIERIRREYYS